MSQAMQKKSQSPILRFESLLAAKKQELQTIMPQGVSVDKFIKTAKLAMMSQPDVLASCDEMSVYRSVMQASLMNLVAGNGFTEGYYIPYNGECTFRASYKGWVKIARRTKGVDLIRASVVYENDDFEISEMPPRVEHKPSLGQRGKCIGAVAVAYTAKINGEYALFDFTFMSNEDLEKARALGARNGPWDKWGDEMRKKTVIRRLCKMLPIDDNGDLDRLQAIENSADNGVSYVDPELTVIDASFEPPPPPTRTQEVKEDLAIDKTKRPGKREPPEDKRGDAGASKSEPKEKPKPKPKKKPEPPPPQETEDLDDDDYIDFGEPES